jgi:hypothetical protein
MFSRVLIYGALSPRGALYIISRHSLEAGLLEILEVNGAGLVSDGGVAGGEMSVLGLRVLGVWGKGNWGVVEMKQLGCAEMAQDCMR